MVHLPKTTWPSSDECCLELKNVDWLKHSVEEKYFIVHVGLQHLFSKKCSFVLSCGIELIHGVFFPTDKTNIYTTIQGLIIDLYSWRYMVERELFWGGIWTIIEGLIV